ncbi:MAG: GNAT family N-acetyltransferase [Telmatospirillum sp.]|nr:GNAT family N-acetyltransferase [Telmatospirillum sp.]
MDDFFITTEKDKINLALVHRFLSEQSGWAKGISFATVKRSIDHSLCFTGLLGNRQIAFARVITDRTTFANLVDVFVLPPYRGQGYGKRLIQAVLSHPDLQGLRRFTLATSDAHGLYARFGFAPPARPDTLMEQYRPDIYGRPR